MAPTLFAYVILQNYKALKGSSNHSSTAPYLKSQLLVMLPLGPSECLQAGTSCCWCQPAILGSRHNGSLMGTEHILLGCPAQTAA